MNQQVILSSSLSKSDKMRKLFELGFSRTQVAEMLGVGYGFVQNVYAKWATGDLARVSRPAFLLGIFNRKFGVEIEAFGVSRSSLVSALQAAGLGNWRVAHDGSIRGTETFELVSPILVGMDGLAQLERVCQILEAKRAKVNKSCGLHIHFEARSFSLASWKNLFSNYANLEGVIDTMMPESRRGNTNYYCGSITGYKEQVEQTSTIDQLIRVLPTRYFKLNTKSFTEHGTVEFRQHSGTIEYAKISNWILFLHGLVSYSEQGLRVQNLTFEETAKFTTPETHTFYHNRINDLAA